jgi:drug/metabolite transporter (DMT)-like permease
MHTTIPICIVEVMTKPIGVLTAAPVSESASPRPETRRPASPRSRSAPLVTSLAAAGFVLAWSSGFTIAAVATTDAPATTLLLWRFLPLAVVLLVVAAARGALRGVPAGELRRQAVIGLLAQFGYVVFVYAAVGAGVTTGSTALVDAVQPLVVATLVGPLLGLRVRGGQWVGLGVGAVGVALVVGSQLGESDASPWAWALPALAMASLIAGTLVERRGGARLPVLTTLTVHVSVTAAALVVLAAVTGTLVPPPSPSFWLATVLSALVPTLAAYGLYWWLLRRVGVTALNALLFLVAPTTAASGALLLGEPLTAWTIVGFVLSAAGSALVLAGERRRRGSADEALAAP